MMDSIDPAALSLHPHQTLLHHHSQLLPSSSYPPLPQSSASSTPTAGVASSGNTVIATTTTTTPPSIPDPNLPPRPDRSKHDAIKARYRVLQSKWSDLSADRARLAADLEAAEQKRDKLQAEADMLIEQMHKLAPDISLAPDFVDLSDSEIGGIDDGNHYPRRRSSYYSNSEGYGPAQYNPLSSSSLNYLDNHDHHNYRRLSTDHNVPSSSINYFSGQLFGPNSGLDFGADLASSGGGPSTSSGSAHSSSRSKRSSNAGLSSSSATIATANKQVMLSPEQAREEEARIEEEQRARQRSKSYNPDNVKVRIGVLPSTFVHPLVQGPSNRSSKSRSPSSTSDNAQSNVPNSSGGISTEGAGQHGGGAASSGTDGERQAKRPRTTSKEKSPVKEQVMPIKEEDEANPP